MDSYKRVETLIAKKYGKKLGTRKAIGDFMLSANQAVNIKSNNVNRQNYSPNMISIKKMHKWVYEDRNELSFIFVDYEVDGQKLNILSEDGPIPIEHISWDCLTMEAQGYGVIQRCFALKIIKKQTKRDFYRGFLAAYAKYRMKEDKKHQAFSRRFIKDPDSIDW